MQKFTMWGGTVFEITQIFISKVYILSGMVKVARHDCEADKLIAFEFQHRIVINPTKRNAKLRPAIFAVQISLSFQTWIAWVSVLCTMSYAIIDHIDDHPHDSRRTFAIWHDKGRICNNKRNIKGTTQRISKQHLFLHILLWIHRIWVDNVKCFPQWQSYFLGK